MSYSQDHMKKLKSQLEKIKHDLTANLGLDTFQQEVLQSIKNLLKKIDTAINHKAASDKPRLHPHIRDNGEAISKKLQEQDQARRLAEEAQRRREEEEAEELEQAIIAIQQFIIIAEELTTANDLVAHADEAIAKWHTQNVDSSSDTLASTTTNTATQETVSIAAIQSQKSTNPFMQLQQLWGQKSSGLARVSSSKQKLESMKIIDILSKIKVEILIEAMATVQQTQGSSRGMGFLLTNYPALFSSHSGEQNVRNGDRQNIFGMEIQKHLYTK